MDWEGGGSCVVWLDVRWVYWVGWLVGWGFRVTAFF
jgi:hypothetical protein